LDRLRLSPLPTQNGAEKDIAKRLAAWAKAAPREKLTRLRQPA
jgi:hypothetical protein